MEEVYIVSFARSLETSAVAYHGSQRTDTLSKRECVVVLHQRIPKQFGYSPVLINSIMCKCCPHYIRGVVGMLCSWLFDWVLSSQRQRKKKSPHQSELTFSVGPKVASFILYMYALNIHYSHHKIAVVSLFFMHVSRSWYVTLKLHVVVIVNLNTHRRHKEAK